MDYRLEKPLDAGDSDVLHVVVQLHRGKVGTEVSRDPRQRAVQRDTRLDAFPFLLGLRTGLGNAGLQSIAALDTACPSIRMSETMIQGSPN